MFDIWQKHAGLRGDVLPFPTFERRRAVYFGRIRGAIESVVVPRPKGGYRLGGRYMVTVDSDMDPDDPDSFKSWRVLSTDNLKLAKQTADRVWAAVEPLMTSYDEGSVSVTDRETAVKDSGNRLITAVIYQKKR
jgi:hypothetical protein